MIEWCQFHTAQSNLVSHMGSFGRDGLPTSQTIPIQLIQSPLSRWLNSTPFIAAGPFPVSLPRCPTNISKYHLPTQLCALQFLSQGLLLGQLKPDPFRGSHL